MNELDLFAAAIETDDPTEREALLVRECAGRNDLRRRLEVLLAAHARPNPVLDVSGRGDPNATASHGPQAPLVGSSIAGRYKLLEEIGDGGMGSVWMAEQREPVKRLVAVKLIKAGMDSKAVLARFEAERQALAMMDHPNIAKVLDGGTTDDGRPFFVMELVKGLSLTEYCDSRKLSVNEQLELFAQICSAVQHAHQKAVIHRDLKPSNVLVTEHDGKPVPKVIDFGLAKALNASAMLTDRTLHTAYGAVVGTPLYMAPEQVGINALDVDTRTDVYALGVILYELLTGSTPLEKARFKEAAWEEVKRLIREEDPPRPSTRLSSAQTLPSLAASRQVDAAKLPGLVRGELDWIVMKALEKNRTRRYETAAGLAKDVQRYLAGDAVEACPPTLGYRLRKAYRRNRAVVLVGSAFAVVLLVATGVSLAFGIAAKQSERRAVEQERVAAKSAAEARTAANDREMAIKHLSGVLAKFNPYRHPTGKPSIQEVLDEACESLDKKEAVPEEGEGPLSPAVRAKVRTVFGRMYMDVHEYEKGHTQLKTAYEEVKAQNGPDDLDTLNAQESYADALLESRLKTEHIVLAEKKLREIYAARVRIQGAGHPDVVRTFARPIRWALLLQGKDGEVDRMGNEVLRAAVANPELGENHPLTAHLQLCICGSLAKFGDPDRIQMARELCRRAKETYTRLYGASAWETLSAEVMSVLIMDNDTDLTKRAQELGRMRDRMIEIRKSKLEPYPFALINLYLSACWFAGEYELGGKSSKEYMELATQKYGPRHPDTRHAIIIRADLCFRIGEFDEAERLRHEAEENFKHLDELAGGFYDFDVMPLNLVAALCILHRNNLKEADFEEAKKRLEKAEAIWMKEQVNIDNTMPRSNRIHRTRQLEVWIELYEKWKQPGCEGKLKEFREELKRLKS